MKLSYLLALGGAVGCTAYPTYKVVPVDCTVEAAYELQSINTLDMVGMSPQWTASDMPDAAATPCDQNDVYRVQTCVEAIPDGPRCGSTAALVMRSIDNNDWGSLFGYNNFGPWNASDYEGLSFWARAPGNSNRAFTILFDDPNTGCLGTPDANGVCSSQPSDCISYGGDGGVAPVTDGTGMIIPGTGGSAPAPDACGNGYAAVRNVTADWRFYTIPFAEFQQGPTPNRVPNAALGEIGSAPGTTLRTNELLTLVLRMPKGMRSEIWIDNLAFYRKASATGGDGGVDAPQM